MRLPEVCPNAHSQTVNPGGTRFRKTMVLAGSPSPKSLATSPQRWTKVKISVKGDLGTGLLETRRLKRSL